LNGVTVGGASVVYTADGGASWNSPTTPPTAGSYRALACNPSGTTLYAAGDAGLVSSTADDTVGTPAVQDIGNIWAGMTFTVPPGGNLLSLQAPSGPNYTLFAGSDDGNVYRLPLASTAWSTSAVLAASPVVGLAFGDDLNGVAVVQGATPGIYYTIDGGVSPWTKSGLNVKLSGTTLLRAVWMNPSLTGYAVGDKGLILKTLTGGK
jgi:hypothetical protein